MNRRSLFQPDSIHPLSGVEPDLPTDDLAILDDITSDARIVALGEPTHGQKEINQLRDRLTRYLVEFLGFRVIAMEDSAIKCRSINNFLINGTGTAISSLSVQNFRTWRTREVLNMLVWLREWNVARPDDPVQFIGIDIQDIATPVSELFAVLTRIDLESAMSLNDRLAPIGRIQMWDEDGLPEAEFERHMGSVLEIRAFVDSRNDIPATDLDLALDCVLSIEQSLRLAKEPMPEKPSGRTANRWNRRDDVMATRALAPTTSGERVILWAHNGHVQSEQMDGLPDGAVTMGQVLREHLSHEYCVISGVFGSGSYRAIDADRGAMDTLDVGDPPVGSIDHELWSRSDSAALIVDLSAPGSVLFEPQITRWAGAQLAPNEKMIAEVRPAIGSNAVAFVREATPSEPL